jgi:surface polysaccharide O-acyltransferase-like enzyme
MTRLKTENRVVWVDYMRVAACFMVLLVHATEPFYLGGDGSQILTEADAYWASFFDSIVRACVPLFIVASSYLQFPLHYSAGVFCRRRAVRILIPFVLWSVVYAYAWGEPSENFHNLVFNFNYAAGHLWFVYMLLGVYLLMPMISDWAERLTKREEEIFLALWLFTTLVPFLRQLAIFSYGRNELWGEANWNEFGALYYASGYVGYLLLGHYFKRWVPELSWRKTLAIATPLWLVGFAIVAGWFWWTMPKSFPVNESIDLAVYMEQSWRFCTIGVVMTTIAYFLVIRKFTCSGRFYTSIIQPLSKLSYGLYLMHIVVLVYVYQLVSSWHLPTVYAILLIAVLTFSISALATKLISFVPKSKYIIG